MTPLHYTLFDMVFLRDAGIQPDSEMMRDAQENENTHRDFAPCFWCQAKTGEQHKEICPRTSLLFDKDWYEREGKSR